MDGYNTNGCTAPEFAPRLAPIIYDPRFYIAQIKSNIALMSGIPEANLTVIIFCGPVPQGGLSYKAKVLAACPRVIARANYAATHTRISWNSEATFVEFQDSDVQPSPEAALKALMEKTMLSMNIHWFSNLVPAGNNSALV